MGEPVEADRASVGNLRSLPPVPASSAGDVDLVDVADLAARLAAALRAVRGYVPHRIWWQEGPADALLAYQTTEAT